MNKARFIRPNWPAPKNVKALQTTRLGGVSLPPYDSLNLGDHVEDDVSLVVQNRQILEQFLPGSPLWLKQVHSTVVVDDIQAVHNPEADACFTQAQHQVCTVMTADCLPVLFCNESGTQVAAAHAGWRGLAGGVLENTLATFKDEPASILAWLGPAIGPDTFEVGLPVYDAFCHAQPEAIAAFKGIEGQNKWYADIYKLARLCLRSAGVTQIYGGEYCTYSDKNRFFSYRRDGVTGRLASCIWLEDKAMN